MKVICLLLFSFTVFIAGFSQTPADSDSVVIHKDARIDELMQKQKDINAQKQSISGFRIQIYFGGDRQKANDMKQEFINMHPATMAYVSYQQPNFKVRVGDFRTRLEAMKLMKVIENYYTSCFIVPDEISIKQLK